MPNGEPKCLLCPLRQLCEAREKGIESELPVKTKAKARKIEKRTVFIFQDGENVAIRKRPAKGLLAGLYELPNIEGELSADEALEYSKKIGLQPLGNNEYMLREHMVDSIEQIQES